MHDHPDLVDLGEEAPVLRATITTVWRKYGMYGWRTRLLTPHYERYMSGLRPTLAGALKAARRAADRL